MNYEIRYVRGHVEVYDQMGRFRFSEIGRAHV